MSNVLKEMKNIFTENRHNKATEVQISFEKEIQKHEENIFKFKRKFVEIFMKGQEFDQRKLVEQVYNILKKRVQKEKEEVEKIVPFVVVRNIETVLDEKIYL
jgi:hypothetical protein